MLKYFVELGQRTRGEEKGVLSWDLSSFIIWLKSHDEAACQYHYASKKMMSQLCQIKSQLESISYASLAAVDREHFEVRREVDPLNSKKLF